jgi:uncharacterized protein (TIGR00255 family)
MTGYGKTVVQLPQKKITIELKSLNSKNIDINCRIPSYYREKELDIRKMLSASLGRGKIDMNIYIEDNGAEVSSQINELVVKEYMKQLENVVKADPVDLLKMAVRLPDSLKTEREELDTEEWKQIQNGLLETIEKISAYRSDEGKVLLRDFVLRINQIQELLKGVIDLDPDRIVQVKDRIKKAISELETGVDKNRFEQELIYYLEKLDITEEKVRLENHLDYFLQELNSKESNGKKLAFISQEIGREINTIGSKSNFAPMQKLVVQMKDELEKIKEQLLNII